MKRILITDAETQQSLTIIESFQRMGFTVDAGSCKRICMGFFSRHVSRRYCYPSPEEFPDLFLERMLWLVKKNRYDILLPVDDFSTGILSKNKNIFSKYTKLPVVDYDVFVKGRNKSLTMKIAMEKNIPCPKTYFPGEESIEILKNKLEYPVLVKPGISSGGRGITKVTSPDELVPTYNRITKEYGESAIQEYIPPGGTQFKADILLDTNLERKAGIVYSKLRYYPVNGGSSVLNCTVERPDIIELATRLLVAMSWKGFADFDIIEDPRDNLPKIIEVNPRFPACFRITKVAGIDFSYLVYKLAMEEEIPNQNGYRKGIYLRYLPVDVLWFIKSKSRFKARPSFFKFIGRDLYDQILSLEDPFPTVGFMLENLISLFDQKSRKSRFSRGW